MLTEAWTIGSIDYGAAQIRTGFTILALVTNDELARMVREVSKEFQKIQADSLRKDFQAIVAGRRERAPRRQPRRPRRRKAPRAAVGGKTPNLDQFTVNLTENAQARARSTRCWRATSRSARWSTS